jgi:UDP-N-acetylmuramoyl-tripeptide--D-alanyl-D-alanine ligase
MNIQELHQLYLESTGVCTDNRLLQKEQLFFALKGDNFDGNSFAEKALETNALAVIIDDKTVAKTLEGKNVVLVTNVLNTLQELARFHRNYLNIPIIGLTGSNGKTTTKELIYSVISQHFITVATIGNLNNHIGVPLTLLKMNKSTEIGIVEMGANHQKEIEFLCTIAQPNIGYITNFGKAHLEGFGGVEGVIKGKSELYTFLKGHNGKALVNLDDDKQVELTKHLNCYTFSENKTSDVKISLRKTAPFLEIGFKNDIIKTNLIGSYNFSNIAAAVALGSFYNISVKKIKDGIENYVPTNNRSQLIEQNSNHIILDAYNANPSSMEAALHNLSLNNNKEKYIILGDMFELGKEAEKEHQLIVQLVKQLNFTDVIFVGENFYKEREELKSALFFNNYDNLESYISKNKPTKKIMLIKGSRGMALERILKVI